MQLRKMALMLTVLGAVSVVLTGCPEEGGETLRCTANTDCLASEICHPDAKVCVQTCTLAAECPSTNKNCEELGGTGPDAATKICKCTTTELCNQDRAEADLVCLTGSEVCAPKCTVNEDCPTGQTCETATGVCKPTTPAGCTIGSCTGGQVCNTTTGACEAGPTCTGTAQGTCSYGRYCDAGACKDAPVAPADCANFSVNRPVFNANSTGAVIYKVSLVEYQVGSSYCTSGDAFIVRVNAYRSDADWPADRTGLPKFVYVTTEGAQTDIVKAPLLLSGTGYNRDPNNLRNAEFNIYLCRPSNSQTIQPGFYFEGGNPVCPQLTRP